MILFAAVDLREGRVVSLYQGDFAKETIYNEDPIKQAQTFQGQGFEYLHVVDLDGAIVGAPFNKYVVQDIVRAVDIPVQVGGGIRDMKRIEQWFQTEARRVILGTVAVEDPELVQEACKEFPDGIVVSLDARGEHIATEGWLKNSDKNIYDVAKFFEDAGAAAILYTDIDRDGTGTGPNIENTRKLADSISIPVIASGGVGSIDDIKAVKKLEPNGVEGVIVGTALYKKTIDPIEALGLAKS